MSPELIVAIKERLSAGQNKADIETAVVVMGHSKEVFEAAYTLAQHDIESNQKGALPKVTTLFVNGFEFAQTHLPLVFILLVPLVVEVLLAGWFEYYKDTKTFPDWLLLTSSVVLGFVYVVTLGTVLYVATRKEDEDSSVKAAVQWLFKNAVPLLFVYILSGLIIFGGIILFIIPGIIAAISLTFAQYVYVVEGKRGMSALLSSRALVKGRFWMVFRKIIGFVFLSTLPVLAFGMVYGLAALFLGAGQAVSLTGEVLMQVVSAVMTVINIHAMYHLYSALKTSQSEEMVKNKYIKVWYWLLAGLTVATVATLAVLAFFFKETFTWLREAAVPIEVEFSDTPAGFSKFPELTLRHQNEHDGSYEGVCDVLRPEVTDDADIVCNDSATSWAFSAAVSEDDIYCADRATPGKKINTPLGDKTQCIAVGE